MLIKVKVALRVTHSSLDTEIIDLIEACKLDLKISGIREIDESDALITRAIIVYCKAHFGFDNVESERFERSYEMLKNHLSLCGEYNAL